METDRMNWSEEVNLPAAETYLALARAAYDTGDHGRFIAARKLLMVALGIADTPLSRTARAG